MNTTSTTRGRRSSMSTDRGPRTIPTPEPQAPRPQPRRLTDKIVVEADKARASCSRTRLACAHACCLRACTPHRAVRTDAHRRSIGHAARGHVKLCFEFRPACASRSQSISGRRPWRTGQRARVPSGAVVVIRYSGRGPRAGHGGGDGAAEGDRYGRGRGIGSGDGSATRVGE